MTEEELKAWKIQKKTEAYEEFQKDPMFSLNQQIYSEKLNAKEKM